MEEIYVTNDLEEAISLKRKLDECQVWVEIRERKTKYGGLFWTVCVHEDNFFTAIRLRKEMSGS